MSYADELTITRHFKFIDQSKDEKSKTLSIQIEETIDSDHGLHVWPCSVVLAQFIWSNRETYFKDKHVLEIGAGTSLPSVIVAKCANPKSVTITDSETYLRCFKMIRRSLCLNQLNKFIDFTTNEHDNIDNNKSIFIMGLTWGQISPKLLHLVYSKNWELPDIILGSDCFYDEADFENIISTIYYLLTFKKEINNNSEAGKFLCTYQCRSLTWSINHLLDKWDMVCEVIPLHTFGADCDDIASSKMPGVHSIQMLLIKLKDT